MEKIRSILNQSDLNIDHTGDLEKETQQTTIHLKIYCLREQIAELICVREAISESISSTKQFVAKRITILKSRIKQLQDGILYNFEGGLVKKRDLPKGTSIIEDEDTIVIT